MNVNTVQIMLLADKILVSPQVENTVLWPLL